MGPAVAISDIGSQPQGLRPASDILQSDFGSGFWGQPSWSLAGRAMARSGLHLGLLKNELQGWVRLMCPKRGCPISLQSSACLSQKIPQRSLFIGYDFQFRDFMGLLSM